MDAILFYGIIILLALGFLSFAWLIVRGWLELIFSFLLGVFKLLWNIIKVAFWVVTLPFRLIGAIFRLFRRKPRESREQDVTSI
ncbi:MULTISPECIES: hypothetical protein [Brevibacillus]|jgi:hypothetical protein|uniref:Uncharacterized protein n=1 Tax=Brevibacillus gelatini TaxID=1655277 RepID=A0A3M8BF27_9BACL|nr:MULTISPECIES: hypothetical protein [Brevibacillus]MBY0051957.1 hypothetical protein [Brevibacillus agri]MCC0566961.1 hypothetical protein [Brevibacillus borstelensis]MCC0567381.1 hypothetical protein [Brevibacillus borstelensis]MCM3561800.1 hypothetical protein [Brevibacillus borstelensis]MCM3562009.1 hypothetical protein [Brevibacillus borstelensis]